MKNVNEGRMGWNNRDLSIRQGGCDRKTGKRAAKETAE